MINQVTPCFCAPHVNSSASLNRTASNKTSFRTLLYTATCAALCLAFGATAASAHATKDKRARSASTTRVEVRARRVVVEKKQAGWPLSKREQARGRESASRREVAANSRESRRESFSKLEVFSRREAVAAGKRDLLMKREPASRRENANKVAMVPNVRKTAIISSPQPNNNNASRPALVNDIVIVSLAEEAPVTSRLPVSSGISTGSANLNMPSIWPVAGTFGKSGFGIRRNPFGGSSTEFHKGQDISAPYGAPVIATADGTVVIAGWLRGYGQVVYIDHGNGISTRYGHLSRLDVTVGQIIKRGQQLGLVGSTGRSTGPHLHYEVRLEGQATNPVPYLPELPTATIANKPGIQ